MSLFTKNLRLEDKQLPWIPLMDIHQLNDLAEKSEKKPQLIFKHSTRCGISRMVLRQFEADLSFPIDKVDLYYLDLLKYRNISNEIAFRFKVHHESPQIVLLKNRRTLVHASHGVINELNLSQYL